MNPIKKSSSEHDFCANQLVSVEHASSPFCIGMDLHSDNVVVVIRQTQVGNIHLKGETVFSRAFKINSPSNRLELYKALEPFCALSTTRAVVESTYNWYWLADEFEKRNWNLRIADPSTVSQAKKKYSDDWTDAEFLAEMVRINSIKSYEYLSKHKRAIRDLCRMRHKSRIARLCLDRYSYDLIELMRTISARNSASVQSSEYFFLAWLTVEGSAMRKFQLRFSNSSANQYQL